MTYTHVIISIVIAFVDFLTSTYLPRARLNFGFGFGAETDIRTFGRCLLRGSSLLARNASNSGQCDDDSVLYRTHRKMLNTVRRRDRYCRMVTGQRSLYLQSGQA